MKPAHLTSSQAAQSGRVMAPVARCDSLGGRAADARLQLLMSMKSSAW
jgi:hypothetical protein